MILSPWGLMTWLDEIWSYHNNDTALSDSEPLWDGCGCQAFLLDALTCHWLKESQLKWATMKAERISSLLDFNRSRLWKIHTQTHALTHSLTDKRNLSPLLPCASFQCHFALLSSALIPQTWWWWKGNQGCSPWALLNHLQMEARRGEAMKSLMKFLGSNIHSFSHPSHNKPMLWMRFTFASAVVDFLHSQGFQTSEKMVPERHIRTHLDTLNVLIYIAVPWVFKLRNWWNQIKSLWRVLKLLKEPFSPLRDD